MLVKVLFTSIMIAVIIWLVYLLGMFIYNHFINSRRRDIEELETHADKLERLLKEARNAY